MVTKSKRSSDSARSGAGFGRHGFVNLKANLRIPPFEPQVYS
jgi:hypothetical protein